MTTVNQITNVLDTIAPLHLAEDWDNVGLLISPHSPRKINRILLTIDLTNQVLSEALRKKSDMIIAYHPPIFSGLKRIAGRYAQLLENRIAVYSPHTALDAAPDGLNDFLLDGLPPGKRSPIKPAPHPESKLKLYKLIVYCPPSDLDNLRLKLATDANCGCIGNYDLCSFNIPGFGTFRGNKNTNPTIGQAGRLETLNETRLEMICPIASLPLALAVIQKHHPYEEPAWEAYTLAEKYLPDAGAGRILTLNKPASLSSLVNRIKKHLNLKHIRLATTSPAKRNIKTIAVCPGAGGSLFNESPHADLYLTGEMRHHDVLAKTVAGSAVILTDHTNTERPYLPTYKKLIKKHLPPTIKIDIARTDADPLQII